jgi:hypothetical protein
MQPFENNATADEPEEPLIPFRVQLVLASAAALLGIWAAVNALFGPYDWPRSLPDEKNRVHAPSGVSIVAPEGWKSRARARGIELSSDNRFKSSEIEVWGGTMPFALPFATKRKTEFQGEPAIEMQEIVYREEGRQRHFESSLHFNRGQARFILIFRSWRRPFPDSLPDSIRAYFETFRYEPNKAVEGKMSDASLIRPPHIP